jgi:ABC-2 type transport system permease protein
MSNILWLVRREFWENRAFWWAPALIAAALLLAALFGPVDLAAAIVPVQMRAFGGMLLFAFGVVFFWVMSLYSTWYLIDCLHAERKDRSVLFWKSLPISDTEIVLSKLATALLAIPLVYFVAADLTTLLIAFIISVRAGGLVGASLWRGDLWLQLQVMWLYLIVTIAIWYLPLAAWIMLISAWARRAVSLWVLLPPVAVVWAEHAFFGTHTVGTLLVNRMFGFVARAFHAHTGGALWQATALGVDKIVAPGNVWGLLDPAGFFEYSGTWSGVAVGAALIAITVRVRTRHIDS